MAVSILTEVPTVAYRVLRHDVFTRHGREWMAAQEPVSMGASGAVEIHTVDGGVVILPREEPLTVRRLVGSRPCTA